jgi:hypothetical protein
MNIKLKVIAISVALTSASGCDSYQSRNKPSGDLPEQAIFQHVEIDVQQESIHFSTSYYSNSHLTIDGSKDKQYAIINDAAYLLEPEIYGDHEYLFEGNVNGQEQLGISFERSGGKELLTSYQLDGLARFTQPAPQTAFDHSSESILFQWDPVVNNEGQVLKLRGSCFFSTEFSLDANAQSYTLAPNTLSPYIGQTSCPLEAHLTIQQESNVNSEFAGGSFHIDLKDSVELSIGFN